MWQSENFQVSTTTGATLTLENVPNALREQNESIAIREQKRSDAPDARKAQATGRKAKRKEASQKRRERELAGLQREEAELQKLKARQTFLHHTLKETRLERRR